jgi:hypothetical protein
MMRSLDSPLSPHAVQLAAAWLQQLTLWEKVWVSGYPGIYPGNIDVRCIYFNPQCGNGVYILRLGILGNLFKKCLIFTQYPLQYRGIGVLT